MLNRLHPWFLVFLLILSGALTTVITRNVHAQERKPWLAVTGMLSKYDMSDVNSSMQERGLALLGGSFLSDIPVSLGFGAALGLDVTASIAVSIAYDRYFARSSGDGINSDIQPGRVEAEISLPANSVSGTLEYRHQSDRGGSRANPGRSTWSVGAGVSGGVIWVDGESIVSIEGEGVDTTTITGTAPLFEGFIAADFWNTPRIGFSPSLGYRYAKVDNPEMRTNGTLDPSGSSMSVDYSGFYVQIALKFALR